LDIEPDFDEPELELELELLPEDPLDLPPPPPPPLPPPPPPLRLNNRREERLDMNGTNMMGKCLRVTADLYSKFLACH